MRNVMASIICTIGLLAAASSSASSLRLETPDRIVTSQFGYLSDERLTELASEAQETLSKVLAFWSVDSGIDRFGKIQVVFGPPRRDIYSSLTTWIKKGEEMRRIVYVYGGERSPQMMAHKLTSAIFPQKDKLIRNAMGILSEVQFGNPQSFPMCGFSSDDWVSALLASQAYIPLSALGPEHQSWGMRESGGGQLSIFDSARQQKAYAEAGSFGNYLFKVYGVNRIKLFNRLSHNTARPSQDAFGATMQELEENWIAALKANESVREQNVSLLAKLISKNPSFACAEAQTLAVSKR